MIYLKNVIFKNKKNIKKLFYSEEKIQIKMKKCTESVYLQFEVDCNALKEKNENIMIINLERQFQVA